MRYVLAVTTAIALAAIGCRKKEPAPTAKIDARDAAAAVAAVVVPEAPFAVVAEGSYEVHAKQTSDGRILVMAGAMLYEAKPNGTLEALLAPSELAKLIVDDETLTGYSTSRAIRDVSGAIGGTLVLEVSGDLPAPEIFTHANGKLTRLDVPPVEPPDAVHYAETIAFRGHVLGVDTTSGNVAWLDHSDAPLPSIPSGVNVLELRLSHGPKGAIVGMQPWARAHRIVVWPEGAEPPRAIPFPSDVIGCTSVPSFAGKIVIQCGPSAYTLEGDAFVKSFARETPDLSAKDAKVSQDAAGAFYVSTGRSVARCLGDAPCSTRELPETMLTRAGSYELSSTEFARSEGSSAWQRLTVEDVATSDVWVGVEQILARGPDDVWVFARRGARIQIFHTSPASRAPSKPKMLPSLADARVAERNARPPARWTSSCDQVYVRLGGDAGAIRKREAEIRSAVGAKEEQYLDPLSWAVVVGELDSERSVGVVLARHDPLQKIAVLESAVKKLVKAFTKGPIEPAVFCSLPVLERKLLPD